MCDHGEDKGNTCLDWFPFGDVYMCECGAILDLADERNFKYDGAWHTMTPSELKSAFRAYGDEIKTKVIAAVNDVKLRH